MTLKSFFFKKSLGLKFSKQAVTQQRLPFIFKTSIIKKFKNYQFLNFLLFYCLNKSLLLIVHLLLNKFFLFKYFLNPHSSFFLKHTLFTKTPNIFKFISFGFEKSQSTENKLFIYQMFFFYKKWKYYEFFFLPKHLWFNFIFILQHQIFFKFFLFNFCNLINPFLKNFKKFNSILQNNYKFCLDYKFYKSLENLINKIIIYWSNSTSIIWNYQTVFIFKNNIKLILIQNYCNKNFTFTWFYQGYQAFLNTNLYLTWSSLFLQNISPISFNFLLLLNFNKLFYWSGDITINYPYIQKFIWSKQNLFFSKGYPYQSFRFGTSRSTYLMPINFSLKEIFFVGKNCLFDNSQSPYHKFIENNKIKSNKLLLFNNYFFYNYGIYSFNATRKE